ncbi:type III pantothenate kinase [bacterium]|nr:type III pantothenate kinase [bacterium]
MLLVIDIGNTNIVFGVYRKKRLIHSWRKVTGKKVILGTYTRDVLREFDLKKIRKEEICGIEISCVVPSLLPAFKRFCSYLFLINPSVVIPGKNTDVRILCDNPSEVGADRIVNAVAGYSKYGGPLIIIDFGTATTFDVINIKGEYMGGVIVPGMRISAEALFERAEKLPLVKSLRPDKVVGKNTAESIRAGLFFGTIGQIKEIISRIKKEIKISPKIILTGGHAELVKKEIKGAVIDPYLTLEGLRLIYEKTGH